MDVDQNGIRAAWRAFAVAAQPMLDTWQGALEEPAVAQQRRLMKLLADNSESAFGRAHGFARISDPVQFRERVPIHTYADLLPWIERAQRETQPVLTAQSPRFFERTSGNSAQQKLIPYTQTFLDEIQVALTIWLADLYRCLPAIAAGRAYWSMSPPMQPSVNALNGIPIGSESDLDYLGGSLLAGLAATLIIPPFAQEASAWRAQTLLALVAAEDLSLISVWSPTFLTSLLRPLFDVGDPAHVGILALLDAALPPSRKSALRQTLTTGMCDALWPRLAAVSCWMDGPSRNFATQLQARFPHALWLPKGLFATEGVVSLPYGTGAGCPLAIESHFLEFLFDDGSVHDAASLRPGDSAQIILTTGGGLYRYALGDRVRVAAMSNCTPRIEFVGRSGVTSDLVGEKLDEDSVASILSSILASSDSACLVPCVTAVRPHYVLLVASGEHCNSEELRCAVERALEGSFHYAHARRLEQLGPLRIRVLTGSSAKLADALQQAAEQSGIRAGDVKPRVLINRLTTANALLALTDT